MWKNEQKVVENSIEKKLYFFSLNLIIYLFNFLHSFQVSKRTWTETVA